ncbi:YtpI family protein [Paenibacillus sp. y28]|uniref:YtpI family protein n=1 Tax=Paenibacillus sp. y28 TaxID=3129110 RepID=UPI003017919E
MTTTLQTVISVILVTTLGLTVFFSIKYRRLASPKARGLNAARMNISMGLLLVTISSSQFLLFEGSSLRTVFAAICLVLGAFNVFAGIRNYGAFSRMKDS